MHAVTGQNHHHDKVGNEQRQIEAVRGVKALEGLVHELALEIMDEALLRIGKEQQRETNVQRETPKKD